MDSIYALACSASWTMNVFSRYKYKAYTINRIKEKKRFFRRVNFSVVRIDFSHFFPRNGILLQPHLRNIIIEAPKPNQMLRSFHVYACR